MELNKMIEELLASKMLENQELGAALLLSPTVSMEEKKKYIDKFVEDYQSGKVDYLSDDHKNLLKTWVELYLPTIKDDIKNRVKRIE